MIYSAYDTMITEIFINRKIKIEIIKNGNDFAKIRNLGRQPESMASGVDAID